MNYKILVTRDTITNASIGWLQTLHNGLVWMKILSVKLNLRSGSIFISLWKLHSGGQGETETEPDTNLLPNVFRPLLWLIYICRISQPRLLPLFVFLVWKFFIRGKNADSLTWKIAFIFKFFQLRIKRSSQSHLTSCEIKGDLEGYYSQQARTPVFLVYFLQKAKANNKSVTLTLAPPASIIMPTKIPWTAMRCFSSNTSQLAIEVSFAMSLLLLTPFRKVIPG